MEIAVAHESGCAGNDIIVVIVAEGDAGLSIVSVISLLRVSRIAHEHTVFVMAEGAV